MERGNEGQRERGTEGQIVSESVMEMEGGKKRVGGRERGIGRGRNGDR